MGGFAVAGSLPKEAKRTRSSVCRSPTVRGHTADVSATGAFPCEYSFGCKLGLQSLRDGHHQRKKAAASQFALYCMAEVGCTYLSSTQPVTCLNFALATSPSVCMPRG